MFTLHTLICIFDAAMSQPSNFSWFVDNKVAGLAYPYSGDVTFLAEQGVNMLINLCEMPPGYAEEAEEHDVKVVSIPSHHRVFNRSSSFSRSCLLPLKYVCNSSSYLDPLNHHISEEKSWEGGASQFSIYLQCITRVKNKCREAEYSVASVERETLPSIYST